MKTKQVKQKPWKLNINKQKPLRKQLYSKIINLKEQILPNKDELLW